MSQPYPTPTQPTRRWWTGYALCTVLAAIGAFVTGGALTDNGSAAGPDACKAALNRAYDHGTALTTWPPACARLDQATRERLIGEVLKKELGESLSNVWKGLETAQP